MRPKNFVFYCVSGLEQALNKLSLNARALCCKPCRDLCPSTCEDTAKYGVDLAARKPGTDMGEVCHWGEILRSPMFSYSEGFTRDGFAHGCSLIGP